MAALGTVSWSLLAVALLAGGVFAEDWPTYRHDSARSGVTTERLRLPPSQCWVFRPRHAPEPAWGDPNPRPIGGWHGLTEYRRVHFDDAFHVAVAGGLVFFGSSATGKVYALDAATGRIRWSAFTGGPVRLAPTAWDDRVYVGSDDGFAYCLRASDGEVVWKFRAAPERRKVLGSGKMISLWPLRTGVLVDDGVAYFGAGIFPAEGIYMYALGAEDGGLIWRNDTCGAAPRSRLSPQGYLLASKAALFAPTGRVSPAAFDRKSGSLLHQAYIDHRIGGTFALIANGHLYTGTKELIAYGQSSPGARLAWLQGRKLVVKGDQEKGTYYLTTEREMVAIDRKTYPAPSLRRRSLLGRRRGLDKDLRKADRDRRKREAAVKASAAGLAEAEKKLAETDAIQRDALRKAVGALIEQSDALEGASERLGRLEGELEAVEEKLKKVSGTVKSTVKWRVPCDCYDSMIMAGDVIFAGGEDKVVAVDARTGEKVWTGRVDGRARGLAVADGRLYVSTDTGAIHCFGLPGSRRTGPVRQKTDPSPYRSDRLSPVFEAAAEQIVRVFKGKGGINQGYCLVMGCGTGRLAYELAKRTDLMIYGVDPDPRNVEEARKTLDSAGVYGKRVCVEQAPLSKVPYSDYFANLIVSETALVSGQPPGAPREVFRMLKPLGGVALIGQPAEAAGRANRLTRSALRRWAGGWRVIETNGLWAMVARGPLKGAGKWTHQHAEPGNTACGDDRIVKCPLGVLWFGAPGPGKMTDRHAQAAAPLSLDGRLFIQGENVVMAYDAYNGVKLWEREIPGAKRTGVSGECGNLALSHDSLFVAAGDRCLRLDVATGKTKTVYGLPPSPDGQQRRWGYVAVVASMGDELLFGSSTKARRNCDVLFAVDLRTGKHRWVHRGGSISHITITIGGGRVFFADTAVTPEQRQEALRGRLNKKLRQKLREIRKLKGRPLKEARKRLKAALDARLDIRLVVALDAATGVPEWQRGVELTDCRRISRGGGELVCMYRDDVLVFCAASKNGHFWKEFFGGDFARRTIVALSARDGELLWSKAIGYRHRPLIVPDDERGDTLIAEPWALDLKTGELKMRKSPLTGEESPWQFARPGHHCGATSACPSTLFFRSKTAAYYDLVGDYGTQHFGSIRPGCWISMIPANGLVMVPEASSGCMCPFPNQCTVVFQPREERDNEPWAMFSLFKPGKQHKSWAMQTVADLVELSSAPVRHLAINLGAPGDRKDADGTLWFGYPRPRGSLVFQYELRTHILPQGGYYRQNPLSTPVAGTDKPWVYASGCRGLARLTLPLLNLLPLARGEKRKPGLYTVRLGFVEPDNDRPGERVFDIKLQGSTVLEGLDVFGAAGGRDRVIIKQFEGIQVDRDLTIELVPKIRYPVLNSIEVRRTKALRVSLIPPSFLLSDVRPEQARDIEVTNHSDGLFVGTLRVGSVPGITVKPRSVPVRLDPGAGKTFTLKAVAARGTEAGEYRIPLKIVGAAGQVESENRALVNHLGSEREIVLAAVEDTFVKKKRPKRNHGSEHRLSVDGGNKEMGDHDHSLVYFKFRLEVPGRPKSARVRLHVGTWDNAESGNSGVIRLVKGEWHERTLTYEKQPELGEELAKIGKIGKGDVVERTVVVPLEGRNEVSIALAPTGCDGGGYCSRETGKPAELVVEFGP